MLGADMSTYEVHTGEGEWSVRPQQNLVYTVPGYR